MCSDSESSKRHEASHERNYDLQACLIWCLPYTKFKKTRLLERYVNRKIRYSRISLWGSSRCHRCNRWAWWGSVHLSAQECKSKTTCPCPFPSLPQALFPWPDYNDSARRNFSIFWLTVASHWHFRQWTSDSGGHQHRKLRFSSESWSRLQLPNCCISGIFSCRSSHHKAIITSFQKVENTLFQVLRNGFNVPGTPFEEIFALRQTPVDNIEESGLENPIHLSGIKADHFRSFLRILYPLWVLMIPSVIYSRAYDKMLQYGTNTPHQIWWVGRSAEFSNEVVFPKCAVFTLT